MPNARSRKAPTHLQTLAEQIVASMSAEEQRELLGAVLMGGAAGPLSNAMRKPGPTVRRAPKRARGLRVRLDLQDTKPPVWRRLEVPGDLTLDRLHDVIQAAMGWSDSHLHRFRTGNDYGSSYFLTSYDVEEGETGTSEDKVRVDQVLGAVRDRLWYEYDFGDGWEHVLTVEAVLDEPPAAVRCIAGRKACPPEDCGGVWGYAELAEWVRGGCEPAAVPSPFDSAEDALDWLPLDWHPDRFDVSEAQDAVAWVAAEWQPDRARKRG